MIDVEFGPVGRVFQEDKSMRKIAVLVVSHLAELTVFFGAAAVLAVGMLVLR
jgi:hypothetical protein